MSCPCPRTRPNGCLDSLRREGRLVLLFEAFDQLDGQAHAVQTLQALLGRANWKDCRMVLSGRPYALQTHWKTLFPRDARGWQFLSLDEFEDDQQRQYLGDERFEKHSRRMPVGS